MATVAKYNTVKGVSTAANVGAPFIALLFCGDFIVEQPARAISTAGIIVLIIGLFLIKDKLLEAFKIKPVMVFSGLVLILAIMMENIIAPVKVVCIVALATSGIDALTFERWYKAIEKALPEAAQDKKHLGFIFAKTQTLMEEAGKE